MEQKGLLLVVAGGKFVVALWFSPDSLMCKSQCQSESCGDKGEGGEQEGFWLLFSHFLLGAVTMIQLAPKPKAALPSLPQQDPADADEC